MLGGAQVKTMSVLVVQNLIDDFQWPAGAALALVLAACGMAAVAPLRQAHRALHEGHGMTARAASIASPTALALWSARSTSSCCCRS